MHSFLAVILFSGLHIGNTFMKIRVKKKETDRIQPLVRASILISHQLWCTQIECECVCYVFTQIIIIHHHTFRVLVDVCITSDLNWISNERSQSKSNYLKLLHFESFRYIVWIIILKSTAHLISIENQSKISFESRF